MKKVLIFIVALTFIFSQASSLSAKDFKIGFADKLKVLFEYNKAKELNEKLEKENMAAKDEFDKRAEEIKKLRDEMELLSKNAKQEKEALLDKKLQELDAFKRDKQQEIGRKYDEGIRVISQDIGKVCEEYGKTKGYDAIIDVRAALYTPESMDVTEDIIKELNK